MMDLNPINTPKSVLTDCVNGTFITYNGNEFVLQNDMGNYELKNCKLPTNFIPVGVKGYADILYIVSYNPLTKEVEIGSYPAPQSIFSTGTSPDVEPSDSDLTPFTINGLLQYDNVIQEHKKNLYVFMDGTDQDTYKMYPGDEFKITGLIQEDLQFPYQHLNFYIIDEDNKLFDIDDTELYASVSEDYKKVFWETPGWLAAQYDLYVPDKFNLNLRSLNVPEFITDNKNTSTQSELPQPDADHFEVSMNLSAQVIISDSLFQKELMKDGHVIKASQQFEHLKVRFKFSCESGNFAYLTENPAQTYTGSDQTIDINCNYHNYQDDIITAYVNCTPVWFMKEPIDLDNLSDYNGTISVEAYPIIDMGGGKILEYTQFTTTYKFQLNNLKNKSAINIGENIYKWSVDDNSCTISFDVNGPFVNANNITGRYEIYRVNLFNWRENLTLAEQYVDDGNSEDLKSASYFRINSQGDKLTKDEEKDEWNRTNILLDASTFSKSWLLMCEGNISNLVLYGQNTLNIDWTSSNKYVLSDYQNTYTNPEYDENDENSKKHITTDKIEKEISFEKEGGIYLLRIVLEQNHEQISDKVLPLIPSEVFNEWFGEKDNYLDENNGITGSDWVNKYWDLISVNVLNPNFNISFESDNLKSLNILLKHNSNEIEWEFLEDEDGSFLWDKNLVIRDLSNLNLGPYKFNSNPIGIRYDIQLIPAINKISGEISVTNKANKGLWNPIGNNNIKFQADNKDIITYNNEHNTYSFNQNIIINWIANGNRNSIPKFISSRYILDSDFLINGNIDGSLIYTGSTFTDPNPGIICSCSGTVIDKTNKEQEKFYTDQTIPWKEQSGKDSYIFGMLGEMLDRGNCCIAPVKFTAKNEVGLLYYPVLISDIDDNLDSAGEGITWSNGGPNVQYLVMRTRSGSSNNSNKTIAIRLNNENLHQFANMLRYIVIYECSATNYEDVYFSSFDLSGLINSENITINRYDYSGQIYQLRCDDESLFNSITLQKLSPQLFGNINFQFNQGLSAKLSPIVITLDYNKNKYYSEFYYNINDAFIKYKTEQDNNIIRFTSYPAGISLQYSEYPYLYDNYNNLTGTNKTNFEEYLSLMFGETDLTKLSTPSQDSIVKIINSLTKKTDSLNYSLSNIALNVPDKGTLKYIENRKSTTSAAKNTAIVLVCYQTDTLGI